MLKCKRLCNPALVLWAGLMLACLLAAQGALAAAKPAVLGLFVGDSDAYACARALASLKQPGLEVRVFTRRDVPGPEAAKFIRRMDAAVVDIMPRQPGGWLLANRSRLKPGAKLYAVRASGRNQDYRRAGFRADPKVQAYFRFASSANLKNLVLFLARRDLGLNTSFSPPSVPPENALYHPDTPGYFNSLAEYLTWYEKSGKYRADGLWDLIVAFPGTTVDAKKAPLDALIRAYEQQGINTVAWMRNRKDGDKTLLRLVSTEPLKSKLGSISGLAFKFSSTLSGNLLQVLQQANVPVFNPQYLFFSTREQWLASPQGISPAGLSMQFSVPELSGLVEPTVIGLKERTRGSHAQVKAYSYLPLRPQVKKLARRAAAWHRLRQKANRDKKIALIYYNHGAGKHNIGASYLNVFRSIREIVNRLRREGYAVEGRIDEKRIKDLLLKSGRNIGSWAPDELERMLSRGSVVSVSLAEYERWFKQTPPEFQAGVLKQWGPPRSSGIMVKDGRFIIPCIRLGNLILAPQPVRGWSDDPDKLYHSTALYPHHQYNAFYYWLQKSFRPDALISLGTHGTHEWLPGKQAGLSAACPPEVLIGDLPNLYPYIVDDVGEGIQAKRRGRGVIIDHATPPFKRGGLYEEYSKLAALISELHTSSSKVRRAKLKRIQKMAAKLGLAKDLGLKKLDDGALEKLEHYLLTLKTQMIPYGLHTFGLSPSGEGLRETAAAMAAKGDRKAEYYQAKLRACGPAEMDSLVRGLCGGYISPGSGNDPLRNPESLPTGKNFYGFDPDKVPSKEAWANGKKAGRDLIAAYRQKHRGAYPDKVGLILWSVETIRDQGINVATALYLMGLRPRWDRRDKIKGLSPIPGAELGRPRIDVLLQMSGLFRDTFPKVALLLDRAVKQAARLDDVENYLAKHSAELAAMLVKKGHSPQEARKLSLVRLFSAPSGAYGTKVEKMTGASGLWEDEKAVAKQGFIDMVSYGYSAEMWGRPLKEAYRRNLGKVKATVHTLSSNLYATMDNDDVFQYLGGLSMAVRLESGQNPEVFLSVQKTRESGRVETLDASLGRELRSRYLNPRWIRGMKKENYAGARAMSQFVENMWGWQVTVPQAVDQTKWEQTFEVYVEDKYGLELKKFFNQANPWAYQSLTARMLEAARKKYWAANERTTKKLAREYALNVIQKGVACCDHTCNNPLLHQMVVQIISLPGVMSPELVDKFKLAVEKAAGKSLDEQVKNRKALLARLAQAPGQRRQSQAQNQTRRKEDQARSPQKEQEQTVEGYRMEEVKTKDHTTTLSSSGVQWLASASIMLLVGLFAAGATGAGLKGGRQ